MPTGGYGNGSEDRRGHSRTGEHRAAGEGRWSQQPDHPLLRGTRDPARASPVARRYPEVPAWLPRLHRYRAGAHEPGLPARGDQPPGPAGARPRGVVVGGGQHAEETGMGEGVMLVGFLAILVAWFAVRARRRLGLASTGRTWLMVITGCVLAGLALWAASRR